MFPIAESLLLVVSTTMAPNARPMWLRTGSFRTQPAGEIRITSSRGAGVAYIEIEEGPYFVLPEEQARTTDVQRHSIERRLVGRIEHVVD